tara:strand:+ start:42713 stop:42934 length:222 start_codon:yes stop_codon:yes gene_type:complete
MNLPDSFHVYRFRNAVALSAMGGDGGEDSPTVYLAPETARALAAQLTRYAADVDARKFSESVLVGSTVPAVAQ